jgi:hypothetical protein
MAGNETTDQLAKIESEYQFVGPEPACGISVGVAKKGSGTGRTEIIIKTLGIHNWTQTGIGTYTRSLCQKK